MIMDAFLHKKSINPFSKENHENNNKIVPCPATFRKMFPNIPVRAKICLKCKLEVYRLKNKENDVLSSFSDAKKNKFESNKCNDEKQS